MTTARRRAIDTVRRSAARPTEPQPKPEPPGPVDQLPDDQVALIFGCCHPALGRDAQVALTLRAVCGLSTRQIAAAFLVPESTMAKRLVRAKAKIRNAGIPFTIPERSQLRDRLDAVLAVIYLIYTEGHAASDGPALVRGGLCDEARWLADLVADLLPAEAEAWGLSALVNLSDARRATRTDGSGTLVLLADQDRSRWDAALIEAGRRRLVNAERLDTPGSYQAQAAIALTHAVAASDKETNWAGIVVLYDLLLRFEPTPIVALNRAVAVSKAKGPAEGLAAIDVLSGLGHYRYYHSARADLLAQLGRNAEAADAYDKALALSDNAIERRFLKTQRARLSHWSLPTRVYLAAIPKNPGSSEHSSGCPGH